MRNDHGVIIVETGPGWVCANAGVDESNSLEDDRAILLPEDPDASARKIRDGPKRLTAPMLAVMVTDTFGRPWRDGLTEICLGIAGINPMLDLRGTTDLGGRELHHTVVAIADELAAAARPADGKSSGDSRSADCAATNFNPSKAARKSSFGQPRPTSSARP